MDTDPESLSKLLKLFSRIFRFRSGLRPHPPEDKLHVLSLCRRLSRRKINTVCGFVCVCVCVFACVTHNVCTRRPVQLKEEDCDACTITH